MQNQNPSFFKILLGDFASSLRLPPLFVKIFGEKLSQTPSLVTISSGKSWPVKLEKSDEKHCFFVDGWSVLATENQLETGDLVVFWLMEDYSTFQVQVYDRTCCDKRLSSSRFFPGFPDATGLKVKKETERDSDDDESEKKKESEEKDEMLDVPATNPSFVTVLSASTDGEMVIPNWFVKKIGLAGKTKIRLVDEKRRRWEIKIRKSKGELVMCDGWSDFRKANGLSKGCICSFKAVGSYGGDQLLQFRLVKRSSGKPYGHRQNRRSL